MRRIWICNRSSLLTAEQVTHAAEAIQEQLRQHVCPFWGLAPVCLNPHPGRPPDGVEAIHLLDDTDQAGAEGYHGLATGAFPEGFVFVRTAEADGVPWTQVLSHEAIEQLIDPDTSRVVLAQWDGLPACLAVEPADPVEGSGYLVGDVPVSNFVLPAWYTGLDVQVDFLGILQGGLTIGAGGYQSYTRDNGRTWLDTLGQDAPPLAKHRRPIPLGRKAARRLPGLGLRLGNSLLQTLAGIATSKPVVATAVNLLLAELLA